MSPSSSLSRALAALLLWSALPTAASAYSTPDAFADSPSSGGGGGRWFTGSPADGYGCSVCHERNAGGKTFPLLVAGLALDGYEPAESREVVLKWPEFSQRWRELRPDPTQPTPDGADAPSMGLVAEFVAESGKASGTVELRGGSAGTAERCEITRPNLKPRIATRMYQVRPGVAPIAIKADRTGTLRCESRQLGQRCVIALSSCGAEETRIVWKAPPSQEGPIWFSAGFVASEALSGTPENDSVFEVSMPMNQVDSSSSKYTQNLRNACSVTQIGSRSDSSGAVLLTLWCLAALVLRRNRQRIGVALIATSLLCACGIEPTDHDSSEYPHAGLYTPGSNIGASDPTDTPDPSIVYGDRCRSPQITGTGSTAGTLTVDYTTKTINGRYAPKNVSAVWIETADEQFVANLEISANLRRPGLVYWQERGCTERDGPDAITSATQKEHTSHSAMWSGVDLNGVAVPDGEYVLLIEVTEDDKEPGDFSTFPFTKGPMAFDRDEVPTIDLLDAVHVTWTVGP